MTTDHSGHVYNNFCLLKLWRLTSYICQPLNFFPLERHSSALVQSCVILHRKICLPERSHGHFRNTRQWPYIPEGLKVNSNMPVYIKYKRYSI